MEKYKLEIYTRPTCSDCQSLKQYLTANRIPFRGYDLKEQPEKQEDLVKLTGNEIVPVLVFKKKGLLKKQQVFIGFEPNRTQIEELIEKVTN